MRRKISLAVFVYIIAALNFGTNIKTADAENGKVLPVRVRTQLDGVTGRFVLYGNTEDAVEREDIWVMYNALSDEDKAVYNLFLDLVEHKEGGPYVSAVVIPEYKVKSLGDKYLWHIYSAMRLDHPEYFYLSAAPELISCTKLELDGYFMYFFDMMENDFSDEIEAFDSASKAFMEDIDLSLSDYEIELQIHDKLLDLVSYDDFSEDALTGDYSDYKYSAYGALVENLEGIPNTALCRGYALAFEHLCHLAGIPCGYVAGEVFRDDSEDDETRIFHAWNVVRIDDSWYEVDVTWDDMNSNPGNDDEFMEVLKSDTEKYYNWKHHYFNRSTFEMRNLRASEDTLFELEGYLPYNPVKDTSHRRSIRCSDIAGETDAFLNSLLPYAR